MAHALGTGERVTVITGECGAGKTALLSVFREQPSHWASIHLDSCRTDSQGLLPWLLHALDAPSVRHMAPDAAPHAGAARARAREKVTALLIDEAQTLKGRELAQLAALLKRSDGLYLFLFGRPGSFQRGGGEDLAALPHRWHVLRPLNRADVEGYIRFCSSACGRPRVTFTDEAIDLVCVASRGSPRLIDRLCDTALDICERAKGDAVHAGLVREAARLRNDVFASDAVTIHAAGAAVVGPSVQNVDAGNPGQVCDLTFVTDIGPGLPRVGAAERIGYGRAYDAGTVAVRSVREIIELLRGISGTDKPLISGTWPAASAAARPLGPPVDTASFEAAAGWRPQLSFEDGLAGTVRWWQERLQAGRSRIAGQA